MVLENSSPPSVLSGILVMKLGGTSVGSLEGIEHMCGIVREAYQDWKYVVIVASALSGVTNLLLESVLSAVYGNLLPAQSAATNIRSRHEELLQTFVTNQHLRTQIQHQITHLVTVFVNLCQAVSVLGEATPRALDAVSSLGERLSVRVLQDHRPG